MDSGSANAKHNDGIEMQTGATCTTRLVAVHTVRNSVAVDATQHAQLSQSHQVLAQFDVHAGNARIALELLRVSTFVSFFVARCALCATCRWNVLHCLNPLLLILLSPNPLAQLT